MPTREAIVDTVLPKEVQKPLPVRVVNTKNPQPKMKIAGQEIPNGNQPPKVGDGPSAASDTTAESVTLSPQLSALARKEQAFRQREQALKQREKDLEAKLSKAAQYESLESKLGTKDYSEVEKLGLNYEEYTKYLLDKQAGEDPQTQAYKKLEAEIAEMKKKQAESDEQAYTETVAAYKTEIASLVASNPEFSSVKEMKREDAVLQYILDTFDEDEVTLTVEQACKDIEEYIVEQGKQFQGLTKFKAKANVVEEKPQLQKPGMKTLTNDMHAPSGTKEPQKSLQHLSETERYAEARRRVLARRQQQG